MRKKRIEFVKVYNTEPQNTEQGSLNSQFAFRVRRKQVRLTNLYKLLTSNTD